MNLTFGNEEAWLLMMLEDEPTLIKMGLPNNMTQLEKDDIVKIMLKEKNNKNKQTQDNILEEIKIGPSIIVKDMIIGGNYIITFPNHKKVKCVLDRILNNSCSDDYIFKNIQGGESLTNHTGTLDIDEFPLPFRLLEKTQINISQ